MGLTNSNLPCCVGSNKSSGASSGPQLLKVMAVLIAFTILFCTSMSVLTRASRHELFAASAAYAAVLVVFVSNSVGGN